jgi:hypothetical protein
MKHRVIMSGCLAAALAAVVPGAVAADDPDQRDVDTKTRSSISW